MSIKKQSRKRSMKKINKVIREELRFIPKSEQLSVQLDVIRWLAEYGGAA